MEVRTRECPVPCARAAHRLEAATELGLRAPRSLGARNRLPKHDSGPTGNLFIN